jgi:8-hydroxy-5-deazaflavin:NADPH oxidoreductase
MNSRETGYFSAPLPLPRYARVAVLGDNDFATALINSLSQGGREILQVRPDLLTPNFPDPAALPADIVFLALPWARLRALTQTLAGPLAGLTVVNCAVALEADSSGFFMAPIPEGSVTAALAKAWPLSRVVGALHQLTAAHLKLAGLGTLVTDVPVVGDDREATDLVEALIDELDGLESVYAGPLRSAGAVEGVTALLREVESEAGHPVGFRFTDGGGFHILD